MRRREAACTCMYKGHTHNNTRARTNTRTAQGGAPPAPQHQHLSRSSTAKRLHTFQGSNGQCHKVRSKSRQSREADVSVTSSERHPPLLSGDKRLLSGKKEVLLEAAAPPTAPLGKKRVEILYQGKKKEYW